jgi:hypothetical protein
MEPAEPRAYLKRYSINNSRLGHDSLVGGRIIFFLEKDEKITTNSLDL